MYRAFGDSIVNGAGASSAATRFISRLGTSMGVNFANFSAPGSMVMDQESAVYSQNFAEGDFTILGFGVNDQAKYLTDSAKLGYFIDGLRSYAVLASSRTLLATPENAVSFSGQWSNAYSYGTYASATPGSKAAFKFDGTKLALGFLRQAGNTSTFRVKIDGQSKGVYLSGGDVTTVKGKPYGPMCLVFSGLTDGHHYAEIEVVNGDGYYPVYFRFFSECERIARVCVLSVPRAIAYTGGGSDSNVMAYNAAISAMVSELQSLGLDVLMIDVTSLLTPQDMFDDVHPADSGHLKYYAAISGMLMNPPVSFVPGFVFSDCDGNLYAAIKSGIKRVMLSD